MSSLPLQYDPPAQDDHRQLSGSSLALICVFFSCFIGIAYLSSKAPRATTTTTIPIFAASSRPRRFTAGRRRPRLWEIWLDEYLGGAVHNWRPLAVWSNGGPMRARPQQEGTMFDHFASAQAWIGRACAFLPKRGEAIQLPASSPPVVLPRDSDPRMLNVAVLVAMPRRNDVRPVPGSMLHPSSRSRLLYDEGQLELGVTSLLCEQAMCPTSEGYERTT
jgi:hypothetical protein